MNVFAIPTSGCSLEQDIHFYSMSSESTQPVISKTVSYHVQCLKSMIDEVSDQWDYTKKLMNPYEYIHTPVPTTHISIAKHKPLSRSYYKLIEIIDTFSLSWSHPINSFHLAEGPGGFIEAIVKRRNNPQDSYTGMTLVSSDYNTPGWRKSQQFLTRWADRVFIEKGVDGTGNLFTFESYEKLKEKAHTHDLITADGGFDFSICYNMQECISSRLVYAQLVYACMLQKEGGVFILKVFDCFTQATVDMLWILSCIYRKVHVMKPCTSRYANSEKYVICQGYRQEAGQRVLPRLEHILSKLEMPPPGLHIQRILKKSPPRYFLNRVEEINAVFGRQQMEMIRSTLSMIHTPHEERNERIRAIQHSNLQKCVGWCKLHHEPYMTLNHTYAEALSSARYRPPKV